MFAVVALTESIQQNVNDANLDIKNYSLLSRNYNTQMKHVIKQIVQDWQF